MTAADGSWRSPGRILKRTMDVCLALVVLVLVAPIMLTSALLVLLEDGRPLLFVQARAGFGGHVFGVFKFRSMRRHAIPAHEMAQVRSGDTLVTRVGAVLRRFKIDELPQLVNVLLGDMSLVGPRPTLPEHVAHYDAFARRRLGVRPGLTGWAQVNGNTELTWEERIWLDVWYVDHWSLALDVRILAMTVRVVLRGERASYEPLEAARVHANAHDPDRSG